MQALRTAATGMAAQQLNVEVISNNIANMNTVGFKRQRAEFQDLLYQSIERAGAQSSDQGTVVPTGVQIGGGVKAGSVYRITGQGAMTNTSNPYDLAIEGRGYLQVLMPSGETAYTRAGNLSLNDQGQLVTEDGYLLQPAITIPQDAVDVTISKTGQVQVTKADSPTPEVAGQIELATFVNESARGHGRQPLHGKRRLRPGHHRRARIDGLWPAVAGLYRGLERRRGQRDHRPDRGPAGLRDELQGHHHRRRDAAGGQPGEGIGCAAPSSSSPSSSRRPSFSPEPSNSSPATSALPSGVT